MPVFLRKLEMYAGQTPRSNIYAKQVIPGYADAHTPAKLEVPVKLAYSQQAEVEGKAHGVISRL
ncbi:unnamed protein product [Ectocarpus sp. CCAP 1310/34]|nr:unnamed protein product [Ectocarpus sp. CCAP 1310/34]